MEVKKTIQNHLPMALLIFVQCNGVTVGTCKGVTNTTYM